MTTTIERRPSGARQTNAAEYLREHAREALALADEIHALDPDAVVIKWGMLIEAEDVFLYHRVENGVDKGEHIASVARDDLPMAKRLAPLHVGESVAYDVKFDRKSPAVHCVDTLRGRYRIVAKLPRWEGSSGRASVGVPVPHNAE